VRTEQLRRQVAEQVPGAPSADTTAAAERELLASVRREHEQVRARLSAIAAYEERLRRLEEHASEAALPRQG
jgi:hypothetical protein